ncbi:MAG: adenylate kinase [Planctomycetota bacterium]
MSQLVFLGPPGAGKGTQAKFLAEEKGLLHLSTGDMFRNAIAKGTPTGVQAKSYMDQGQLVPDSVVDALVVERLKEDDARGGYLLDGYPRNLSQAEALDGVLAEHGTKLDGVLFLDVPDDVLIARIVKRGEESGGARADDTEEVARERLVVYREHTEPLVKHYEAAGVLVRLDGTKSIDDVKAAVFAAVEGMSA